MSENRDLSALTRPELVARLEELQRRLGEAEETLRAIREGDVDAVIVSGSRGDLVFSLNQAESIYRLMVETMNEAGLAVTPDGTILFANNCFARMLGVPLEQVVGKPLAQFTHADHQPGLAALLEAARQREADARLVLVSAEGGTIPVHAWANLLERPDGPTICLVGVDLTQLETSREMIQHLQEQRHALAASEAALRKSEAKARDLIKYAPTGIYEVDFRVPRFVEVNDVMCQYLGYTREELLTMNPGVLMSESEAARFQDRMRMVLAGKSVAEQAEYWVKTKDGHEICALLNVSVVVEDGKPVGATVIAHDITERKRAEQELAGSREKLEVSSEQLSRRVEELRAANEQLQRFNTIMVGRELRMMELKKEVNELRAKAGLSPEYRDEADKNA